MSLPDFQIFANRLTKMARHYDKWARRQEITCYRIYDADLPEFPLAIDRYEDYLHVAEYDRRHSLSPEEYKAWRSGCRLVMQDLLGMPSERIYFKKRQPQKGKQQYEKQGEYQQEIQVREDGLLFRVNLSDYLDTGLFLDHRLTRKRVREQAHGKQVLNLFAYTGSFSVYAAAGGASSTTTIDLSNTYLDWAKCNMALNGFEGPAHRYIRADVKEWLQQPVRESYDLVILDPPTFSNSKAMRDILDVQRDHPSLINSCLKRMTSGGILLFSTNFRRFFLEADRIEPVTSLLDITAQTIPPDFRNKKIHYCWELVK